MSNMSQSESDPFRILPLVSSTFIHHEPLAFNPWHDPMQLRPKREATRTHDPLSKSASSWFLGHQRSSLFSEEAIQAATLAASVVTHHHVTLPPVDLASLDLGACRAALRDIGEMRKKQALDSIIQGEENSEGAPGSPKRTKPVSKIQAIFQGHKVSHQPWDIFR